MQLSVKYETVLNMTTAKAWPRCADIDPAERGRVDRIGIPQRKKTGSPTAAMGQDGKAHNEQNISGLPTIDGVIGLPACGYRKIRVLRFRLMVKRGP